MKLKISVAGLRLLWGCLCRHKRKYMKPTNPQAWSWADCKDCVLGKIPWQPALGATRNLCFLIWHEKILE